MAAPLIAAGIAAGAGLIGSAINSYTQDKATQADIEAREKVSKQLLEQGQITDSEYKALLDDINQYYENRGSLGTEKDVDEYRKAIVGYKPEDYVINYEDEKFKFNHGKTKEDFLNPYMSNIIQETADTVGHSAAGAGLGRGTGAALGIANAVATKKDELYRTAMADYKDDRDFAYKKHSDDIANNQKRLDALRAATKDKIDMYGNLYDDYFNTKDSAMADQTKVNQDRLASKMNYSMAIAGMY